MAASPTWCCAACGTHNTRSRRTCLICDEARPAARSGTDRTGGPARAWNCVECGTHNARDSLACVVCDASWKTAARPAGDGPKPTPKPSPKPSPARPTAPRKPRSATTRPAGSGTAEPRSGTAGPASGTPRTTTTSARTTTASAAPGRGTPSTPPPLLFPPPAAAEPVREPEPPRTTTVPRPAAPPRSTYPRPRTTPVRRPTGGRRTRRRWLKGCLVAVVVLCFGPKALNGCMSALDSSLEAGRNPTAGPTGPSCPSRIAKKLPGAGGKATLVRAYRTSNKQITLCRTDDDRLYYYGEFIGRPSTGLAMEAEQTDDGYVARNNPYRYTIHDGEVVITRDGSTIGRERLVPEPSPS
ncbi:zinc finger protein [Streptomyces murinus]|uniref:zinc finger protein n=1 Tax=Streptomyces murinus TaxID=33900 RepID=UPI0038067696